MTIGDVVAGARERAGITLRVLAVRLGFSHTFLHDIEHGRRRLPVARWSALVGALGGELTLEQLAESAVAADAGTVEVSTRALTAEQRAALAAILVAEAQGDRGTVAGAA
jgi:transcriptional regulator with XRE-family HTH domain